MLSFNFDLHTDASSMYVFVFNFRNMHAMSHRADIFFACTSQVNIEKPAFKQTITYLLTVTQVQLPRIQFSTAMSDTTSFNTSFLEVMIASKTELVCNSDLSDLDLEIRFNDWWASMNVGSEQPIAWINS